MKVYNEFVNIVTPELSKHEFQLCLILLEMYYFNNSGILSMPEIKNHPLMTVALKNNIRKVINSLNGRKIVKKYQDPKSGIAPYFKIEKLQPEFVLFEKLNVSGKILEIKINEKELDYYNKYGMFDFDPSLFHKLDKFNLIKLYMWYRTWETIGNIKCNVEWLKMYLDINVETRSLNDKYIKEFKKAMQNIGVNIKTENLYEKSWTSSIVYIMFGIE